MRMPQYHARWIAAGLGAGAVVALAACANDRPPDTAFTVRDSAGVRIVESGDTARSGVERWRLAQDPSMEIGGETGGPGSQLFQVVDATRLSDGGIVVANAGSSELRFFTGSGDFVKAVGRAGAGPGEFRAVSWVQWLPGDTLAVWDRGNRRLSAWTATGDLALEVAVNAIPNVERRPEAVALVDSGIVIMSGGSFPVRTIREPREFWLYARDGAPIRALLTSPGPLNFEFAWGQSSNFGPLPFGPSPGYAAGGARFYVSTGEQPEVRVVDVATGRNARWRLEASLPVLTDSMIEDYETTVMEGAPADPEGQAAWRRWFDDVPYPEHAAVFTRLVIGRDGVLWAAGPHGPTLDAWDWWVFAPTGQLLGTIRVPEDFRLFDAGTGWLIGRWVDAMGIEYVQIYEVLRTPQR